MPEWKVPKIGKTPMTDARMRFFGNLHPAVSMTYFVLVLGLTLGCMHPVTVALSFLGAAGSPSACVAGKPTVRPCVSWVLYFC